MSVHMKKRLTKIKIDSEEFLLSQRHTKAILSLVKELSIRSSSEDDLIPSEDVFNKVAKGRPKGAVLLRGSRGKENISQKELSKKTGISVPNISAYENGSRKITEPTAKRFARALKTDYKKFLK